jgi:hypothetical protein
VKALLGLVSALALVAGCASNPGEENVAGFVDIGAGRWLSLNCQGSGSPTVFIIPGKGSYAAVWNVVVPTDDPIRLSRYDVIDRAELGPSPSATQPTVARTTVAAPTTGPTPARTDPIGPRRSRSHTRSSRTSTMS